MMHEQSATGSRGSESGSGRASEDSPTGLVCDVMSRVLRFIRKHDDDKRAAAARNLASPRDNMSRVP
jgi:hypothetical protein